MTTTQIKTYSIILGLPLLCGAAFAVLLNTHFYAYLIYILLGFVFYLLMKLLGKESSFAFWIPLFVVALVAVGRFFLLDFYDHNGLNPLKIHPFVVAWLIAFALTLLEDLLQRNVKFDKVVITSLLVIGVFFLVTFLFRGFSGFSMLIHNYIAPISFFLYFYYQKTKVDAAKVQRIIRVLVWIAAIIGIIGILEYMVESNPMQNIYDEETPTWLDSTFRDGYRIKTIIGHPLDNGLFFLFSMMIVQLNIQNAKIKYPLLLLFAVDLLLTGSRSFFLISFLVFFYSKDMFSGGLKSLKQSSLALVLSAVIGLVTLATPLGTTFLNRVGSAGDSSEARWILIDYFTKHIFSFQMMGLGGATETITLVDRFNNPVYLENPWVILFFDVGYLILLYIFLLFLILRRVQGTFLVLVMLLALSGYNSFGVRNNANFFLFYLLAYGYVLAQEQPDARKLKEA
ncbi:hypothetical protein [Paenibacillus mucilaginosus]|uniref:Uncharacterized protein n=1 Tax=Paenibacillus mucilaginosus (strain KNP414) TaxID=1036673 RepID=F8F7Q4_PAEMK|nr:hypothetical protein [Paenibacillus mucilaginosus]AEI39539.1 hypothetical protein KNP414_00949 [Paenibacillus mucilaginosus KNP414]MCG7214643.1 hypothetical protein [Paenibacillus mucilaginosus]WDM28496.1 hypothetical protein KCX80_04425 [Paenibacillus mucilaginosus]